MKLEMMMVKFITAIYFLSISTSWAIASTNCNNWMRSEFWREAQSEDVNRCINAGKYENARNQRGETPLSFAIQIGSASAVQSLIDNGARVDNELIHLHLAALRGDPKIVQIVLDAGADIRSEDPFKHTALHYASFNNNIEVVKLLLDAGADVNAKGGTGQVMANAPAELRAISQYTPLHIASILGNSDITNLLIDRGANVKSKDKGKNTPLHYSSATGNPENVKKLLEEGADVNATNSDAITPLMAALFTNLASRANKSMASVIKILLDAGANPNTIHADGLTPLHLAVSAGSNVHEVEIIRMLINNGADPAVEDDRGIIPVEQADQNPNINRNSDLFRILEDSRHAERKSNKKGFFDVVTAIILIILTFPIWIIFSLGWGVFDSILFLINDSDFSTGYLAGESLFNLIVHFFSSAFSIPKNIWNFSLEYTFWSWVIICFLPLIRLFGKSDSEG